MAKEDLLQVVEINKEAFPTQWPPANYRSELHNIVAHYFVACLGKKTSVNVVSSNSFSKKLLSYGKRLIHLNHVEESPVAGTDFIVGFAGCWIMAEELHITEIAVRQQYRRQGMGKLLLLTLIDLGYKEKARVATLEVRVSNTGAQQLYTQFGFEKVGIRRAYYTDNKEDAYIMTTPPLNSFEFQNRIARIKSDLATQLEVDSLPEFCGR